MTILKIARMGHPVLRTRAEAVPDPTTPDLRRLVRDMQTTLDDAGGVGLAAPQVHESVRLFLYFVPASRAPDGVARPLSAVFNPVLAPLGDEVELGWEGCLSIPGLRAAVPRHKRIRLTGINEDGLPIDEILHGFAARVVQHEADHLEGVLYPMRMEDFRAFGYNEELERYPYPLNQG
jgi:peptide deformylase